VPAVEPSWVPPVPRLSPFLLFGEGNCAEAMAFYQSVFGGELSITRLSETPMSQQMPSELQAKVAYAHLRSAAIELSAVDWMHPTRVPRPGNTVAVYVSAATYGELRQIFDKLSLEADPDLLDELHDEPFGTYGHLADRYGVHWFFRGDDERNT
jgi:PhnB protein